MRIDGKSLCGHEFILGRYRTFQSDLARSDMTARCRKLEVRRDVLKAYEFAKLKGKQVLSLHTFLRQDDIDYL